MKIKCPMWITTMNRSTIQHDPQKFLMVSDIRERDDREDIYIYIILYCNKNIYKLYNMVYTCIYVYMIPSSDREVPPSPMVWVPR